MRYLILRFRQVSVSLGARNDTKLIESVKSSVL